MNANAILQNRISESGGTNSTYLLDKPSPPGVPFITEVGGDFVNLSWDKPESDGGSRIQGYWIEKREFGSETWQRVNPSLCIPTQINISNLIEDRQYEFRVFAQNEGGLSSPSYAKEPVKIKDPMGMFHFNVNVSQLRIFLRNHFNFGFVSAASPPVIVKQLRNCNVIQNANAQFQCTITGVPKPTITWYILY